VNKFAVITRCQRKKFFKKPIIIDNNDYVMLELPYTIEEMQTVDESKLYKSFAKGIRKLQQMGISRGIFTNTLKEIFPTNLRIYNFRVIDGTLLFFDFVPKIVDFFCEKYEFSSPNMRIAIREEKLSGISKTLIEQLCYRAKFMSIYTADMVSSKRYADFLMDKLGFMLEIRDISNDVENGGNDIVIDVDNFSVSVVNGDTIDGMVIDGVLAIEDTEIFDVMLCLGLGVNDVFVSLWKNGDKNIDIAE